MSYERIYTDKEILLWKISSSDFWIVKKDLKAEHGIFKKGSIVKINETVFNAEECCLTLSDVDKVWFASNNDQDNTTIKANENEFDECFDNGGENLKKLSELESELKKLTSTNSTCDDLFFIIFLFVTIFALALFFFNVGSTTTKLFFACVCDIAMIGLSMLVRWLYIRHFRKKEECVNEKFIEYLKAAEESYK